MKKITHTRKTLALLHFNALTGLQAEVAKSLHVVTWVNTRLALFEGVRGVIDRGVGVRMMTEMHVRFGMKEL